MPVLAGCEGFGTKLDKTGTKIWPGNNTPAPTARPGARRSEISPTVSDPGLPSKDVQTYIWVLRGGGLMVWCSSLDTLILWQEEAQPHPHTEEVAPPAEPSSRSMSLEVDSSSEASSGRSHRSFIGLSDMELLKFAFSHPQTEGATESPEINGEHFLPTLIKFWLGYLIYLFQSKV